MTDSDGIPTITCLQAQENALALLGGELSDFEERQLHIHLANCDSCREQARQDMMVFHMLATCPAPVAAPDFNEKLFQRLAEEDEQTPIVNEAEIISERIDITASSPRSKRRPSSSFQQRTQE